MEQGSEPELERCYGMQDVAALLRLAHESICHGLQHGQPVPVEPLDYSPLLQQPTACFVSLHRLMQLRGCIGTLEACMPLVRQVAESAYAAAFRDWRFPPLKATELDALSVDIHVLSAVTPLAFEGLTDLYAKLEAGRDGLLLELGVKHAVFLPVMWKQLPQPAQFVAALLHKGQMNAAQDLSGLRASRFSVEEIHESPPVP